MLQQHAYFHQPQQSMAIQDLVSCSWVLHHFAKQMLQPLPTEGIGEGIENQGLLGNPWLKSSQHHQSSYQSSKFRFVCGWRSFQKHLNSTFIYRDPLKSYLVTKNSEGSCANVHLSFLIISPASDSLVNTLSRKAKWLSSVLVKITYRPDKLSHQQQLSPLQTFFHLPLKQSNCRTDS